MADEQKIWGALKHDRELAEMYLLRYSTMVKDYERNKRVLSGLSIRAADENGVLGRIDDIHDSTYDCEMITGEKYALRIGEADKKFKKITW